MRLLILIMALVLLPVSGWGANKYSKSIAISGTGAVKTNYITPYINLHYGHGLDTATDIFLGGKSQTDFDDVRFYDQSGNEIPYYRHSHGNYEVVADDKIGIYNLILASGRILSSRGFGTKLYKSDDNGKTYTLAYDGTNVRPAFQAANGYIYASDNKNYQVLRSTDNGDTWSSVLDLSATSAWFVATGITEDSAGNIYIGSYQEVFNARVFKSTDNGASFTQIKQFATGSYQHCHSIKTDPYTGYLYVGLDGSTHSIARSVDGGANWTTIYTAADGSVVDIFFGNGYRILASDSTGCDFGTSVLRTTDDTIFTAVLKTSQTIQSFAERSGVIYAGGVVYNRMKYPAIYRSDDNGMTWTTIWGLPYLNAQNFDGPALISKFGTPTASTEAVALVGSLNASSTPNLKNYRLYSGGNHYQGMFALKIPVLPATGTTIKVKFGDKSLATGSTNIYSAITHTGLIARYKMDEGTGTSLTDSSGNNYPASITTVGAGAWSGIGGSRAGYAYPYMLTSAQSYYFGNNTIGEITSSSWLPAFQFVKNFTVLMWIKTPSPTTKDCFISKGSSTGNSWGIYADFGRLRFLSNTTGSIIPTEINPNISDNQWHLVGVSVDNSTPAKVSFVVDGYVHAPISLAEDIVANTHRIRFGADSNGNFLLTGAMSDVQIYNRALTAKEMRQIYESRLFADTEASITGTSGIVGKGSGGFSGFNLGFGL